MCKQIFFVSVFLCAGFCSAATWTVNSDGSGDFTDIQSAINAAGTGDIIEIADGIYSGAGNQNISFLGKAITVKSINGPEACMVEGDNLAPSPNRGFIFESDETRDSILEGITIRNFWYLTCCEGGAGIFVADGDPIVRNCKVLNCQTELDACPCQIYGAGISVLHGSPWFDNCVIKGNSGSYYGGGIACGDYTANVFVFLSNCIIAENSAAYGGGVYEYYIECSQVKNCTIVYNNNYGLYCQSPPMPSPFSSPVIENLFWRNTPDQSWVYAPLTSRNYTPRVGLSTRPEPRFVDTIHGDYHLQWDSPCIDFCEYAEYGPSDVDLDGEPRCMGQYVDAGADEVGPQQADFSRNGKIDLVDLKIFSAAWGTTPSDSNWYMLCDLAEDELIDLSDLQQLCSDWLWQADWYE